MRSPVARYLAELAASELDARAFARWALVHRAWLCLQVMEVIGSWPSSEPELAALQAVYP